MTKVKGQTRGPPRQTRRPDLRSDLLDQRVKRRFNSEDESRRLQKGNQPAPLHCRPSMSVGERQCQVVRQSSKTPTWGRHHQEKSGPITTLRHNHHKNMGHVRRMVKESSDNYDCTDMLWPSPRCGCDLMCFVWVRHNDTLCHNTSIIPDKSHCRGRHCNDDNCARGLLLLMSRHKNKQHEFTWIPITESCELTLFTSFLHWLTKVTKNNKVLFPARRSSRRNKTRHYIRPRHRQRSSHVHKHTENPHSFGVRGVIQHVAAPSKPNGHPQHQNWRSGAPVSPHSSRRAQTATRGVDVTSRRARLHAANACYTLWHSGVNLDPLPSRNEP